MLGPWSTFLLSLLAAVVAGDKTSHDKHKHDLLVHYEHLVYIADFDCHLPQPRVIPSHRLFTEKERHGKAYFPDVTVLHRCDDAVGCCPQDEEHCGVLHQESVHLPFKITFLEDIPGYKRGSWIIDYFYFYNHTECGCAVPNKKSAVPEKKPAVPEKKPTANLGKIISSTEVPFEFQPLPTSIPPEEPAETSSNEPSTVKTLQDRISAAIGWKAPFSEQPSQKL